MMRNELEWARSEGRWGKAAGILERSDDPIADSSARQALATLLAEIEKNAQGRPRKRLPDDTGSLAEVFILAELNDLVASDVKKEAAKVEIANKHGISVTILEQLDAKYRDWLPHLIK